MNSRQSKPADLLDRRVRITNGSDEGRVGTVERVEHEYEIHVWLDPVPRPFLPAAHACVGVLELELIGGSDGR